MLAPARAPSVQHALAVFACGVQEAGVNFLNLVHSRNNSATWLSLNPKLETLYLAEDPTANGD